MSEQPEKSPRPWTTWWRSLDDSHVENLYWFFALIGVLPALLTERPATGSEAGALAGELVPGNLGNPFGWFAVLLSVGVWLLARRISWRPCGNWYFLALGPLVLLLANSAFGAGEGRLADLYTFSVLAFMAFFALVGRVGSRAFFAFVVVLFLWRQYDALLSIWAILLFVLAVLVARVCVEAVRQNLPLVRELGRSNMRDLGQRTFFLWWPMLILIGIGIWLGAELSQRSEEALYRADLVIPYCTLDPNTPDDTLVCPPDHTLLKAAQFDRGLVNDVESCSYKSPLPFAEETVEGEVGRTAPPFTCPPNPESQSEWPVNRLPLFDSIDKTVALAYANKEQELAQELAQVKARVEAKCRDHGGDTKKMEACRAAARSAAAEVFGVVPSSTGMRKQHCGEFPWVPCEAGNLVIGELNRAYKKARTNSESKFVTMMGNKGADAKGNIDAWVKAAEAELSESIGIFESNTRGAIARFHTASKFAGKVLWLLLVIATVKSILYVFARVIFDRSTPIDIDLLEREGDPVEGRVRRVQEVDIPADYPYQIYYKSNYQPLGPAPRFCIPQWRASLLSRIRHGAWNMSHVPMPLEEGGRLSFNSIEAEHLVDWEMQEGEEIVFSYRHFVAMNENVQLKTVISLRVATLLFGRMVFHTAVCRGGPGRLILRTRGKPATAQQVQQSIPAARLVAWNRYARFAVDSHLTRADIFLNGFNLRRSASEGDSKPQGILVVEADARDGGVLVGTLRFARNFLLPI